MPEFIDNLNRKIILEKPPEKIISLVPSVTELLFDLGLSENISGVTKYCVRPKSMVDNYIKVGGVENIDLGLIDKMNPDLIIVSKEENSKREVDILSEKFPVFVLNINSFDHAINMIFEIGEMVDRSVEANSIISLIISNFESINKPVIPRKVVYLIWKNPYMTINKNTFINDMLEKAGLYNVFRNMEENYPVIKIEEILDLKPEYIFLSSEPYQFKNKDLNELRQVFPEAKTIFVDGEMFSWYGSRMKYAPEYFQQLF